MSNFPSHPRTPNAREATPARSPAAVALPGALETPAGISSRPWLRCGASRADVPVSVGRIGVDRFGAGTSTTTAAMRQSGGSPGSSSKTGGGSFPACPARPLPGGRLTLRLAPPNRAPGRLPLAVGDVTNLDSPSACCSAVIEQHISSLDSVPAASVAGTLFSGS